MIKNRKITYCEAIQEAICQEMERDENVFIYGEGVTDPKRIFGTTDKLLERFEKKRCFDTPVSEDSLAGFGLGASVNGLRPIFVNVRMDFLLLGYSQISNMISSFRYNSGGKLKVPLVIRGIIGRGWGQGSQHSKSMHSVFAHIPGLKVVMPTTPYDAKGLLISAIRDDNPVLYIEHRWLYFQKGHVPEQSFEVPIGIPNILKNGNDITIIATSWMNVEVLRAAEILNEHGVNVEIIDVRTVSPFNYDIIVESVNKTKCCLIVDNDWAYCGVSAEISSIISNKCFGKLKFPVERIGFSHTPCPTARHLENEFYPNSVSIIRNIEKILKLKTIDLSGRDFYSYENKFKGPF